MLKNHAAYVALWAVLGATFGALATITRMIDAKEEEGIKGAGAPAAAAA